MGNVGVTALTQDGIIIKWHHISFISLTRLFEATHNKCIQPWKYNPFTPCPFHLGVEHTHHLYIIRPPPEELQSLCVLYLLMTMSSQSVRAKKGTEGKILRDSLMTQSRYLSSFRSSMVMARLDPPEQRGKVSSPLPVIHNVAVWCCCSRFEADALV